MPIQRDKDRLPIAQVYTQVLFQREIFRRWSLDFKRGSMHVNPTLIVSAGNFLNPDVVLTPK
jgi:hypothetical protein